MNLYYRQALTEHSKFVSYSQNNVYGVYFRKRVKLARNVVRLCFKSTNNLDKTLSLINIYSIMLQQHKELCENETQLIESYIKQHPNINKGQLKKKIKKIIDSNRKQYLASMLSGV